MGAASTYHAAVGSRRDRLLAATSAIRAVLRNGDIGRLEAGWLAANAGTYAFLVVTLVVAYNSGGAFAAGLMGVVRAVPPTLIAPFAGLPSARWRPDRVLLAVNLGRAIAIGATSAVLAFEGPVALVFLLVGIEAGFGGLTRPMQMSLLPWVARTPGELVAANIASSAAEGIGTLIGPAIAGIALAASGPAGASGVTTAITVAAVAAVATVHVPMIRTSRVAPDLRRSLTAGMRAFVRIPTVRLVLLSLSMQTFVRGMLVVLLVVTAIERLDLGEPGVGTLNAAIGAGGFVGAVVALSLTGRRQFSSTYALALAFWGLPIAVIGVVETPVAALAMLAIVGMSNAVLDVTGYTLLQRSTPNDARVGVMGMLDSLVAATAAIGGLVASVLVASLGIQGALVATGAILPITAAITLPLLRRAESRTATRDVESRLLAADPLLGLLSLSVVEELAAVLRPVDFDDGDYLIREGERGDHYLIVADGQVEVSAAGRAVRRLGPGSGVGEISLLRNVPRSASVRADGAVRAYALDADAFLSALTGQPIVRVVADSIIDGHLARSAAEPSSSDPGGA